MEEQWQRILCFRLSSLDCITHIEWQQSGIPWAPHVCSNQRRAAHALGLIYRPNLQVHSNRFQGMFKLSIKEMDGKFMNPQREIIFVATHINNRLHL